MKLIARAIPVIIAAVGVGAMYVWLSGSVAEHFEPRLPGRDGRPTAGHPTDANQPEEPTKIAGRLLKSDGIPADLPGAWPRFRGADLDAISKEDVKLARTWPEQGPDVLWSIPVGEGYAGAAVLAGRVYIVDYDQEKDADAIRCLSLADGKEIWRYSYPIKIKRWHGMSRGVPAVTDKHLVAMGPKCHVTCVDSMTGEFRWMFNLVKEFKTIIPEWYTAQSPLIDDGKAIIAPAGDVLMIAVDCESGRILWKTPNPDGWVMTHSSIVPMDFNGKRFYVYCAGDQVKGAVVGVSAEDGTVLWQYDQWKVRFNVPTPVVVAPDRILLTAGYSQTEKGCTMLRFTENDGKIAVESEFLHSTDVFGSIQQTPIFYNGYIYGVRPDEQLVCLDQGGNVVWTSSSANKFGFGPYTIADGLMYVMNSSGRLTLVRPDASGYVQLAQADVIDGHETWGPMAVVSGRLIVRDLRRMMCLDVSQH
ncbi:MAG: PQQ-like beta-propeller repeat protein [Sedimentisphaerales bacterium]|nr:PQQ-like beta-propeller repeat protein [Sedimentisphaerales bacterium]